MFFEFVFFYLGDSIIHFLLAFELEAKPRPHHPHKITPRKKIPAKKK